MNKTEHIFRNQCPYNNHFQGPDKRLLFVCSAGLLRSATAANLFAKKGYNTRSCGSASYALIPFSENLLLWADHIYVMKNQNYFELEESLFSNMHDILYEKTTILSIDDEYEYNSPVLLKLLNEKVKP